jgi:L-histidine Nalpha-methyltransferase
MADRDSGYRVLTPQDLQAAHGHRRFALDVLHGLSERPKRLPSRWIYDEAGSRLFQEICELEEYYPTRCETEILRERAAEILAGTGGGPLTIVDLGAGDGRKSGILLDAATRSGRDLSYAPLDISEPAMRELVSLMRARFPALKLEGVIGEYFDGLHWISSQSARRHLVLFLGSNIGNFNRAQSRVFLRQLWEALNPGDLVLIGFDLKKDMDLLLDAYNDPRGVTGRFNTNLLARINRELGGEFDMTKFRHYATYDVFSGAMESYIVSQERQTVAIRDLRLSFEFEAWEPIHTEYSYKYTERDVESLAADTGFAEMAQFYDARRWFLDSLWRVEKA